MNTGYPKREVEKVKVTQRERHNALRVEVGALMERLGNLDKHLKAVLGHQNPVSDDLVRCARLFDRLVEELRK